MADNIIPSDQLVANQTKETRTLVDSQVNAGFFNRSKAFMIVTLVFVVFLGLGLRFLDLTEPPLDFHAWRQLRSAVIARGYYYQYLPNSDPDIRELAMNLGKTFDLMEPPIFEGIVAFTYLVLGKEVLWVARVYSILFWAAGGVTLFLLARKLISFDGAIVSLLFYFLVPFGIYASRSFQPDPIMVSFTMIATYSLYMWTETRSWKWTLIAGATSGLAVLFKIFAVFPIAITAVLLVLLTWKLKEAIRNPKVWAAAILMFAIPASYYLVGIASTSGRYLSGWILGFSELWKQPWFYVRWLETMDSLIGLGFVLPGLMAIFLLKNRGLAIGVGLWAGYFAMGMSVPSLIISHSYYNLLLVPVVAFSLAPLAHLFLSHLKNQARIWQAAFMMVAVMAIFYPAWTARTELLKRDYRLEAAGWKKLANSLPRDATYIGLTHDYNTRLKYYGWIQIAQWLHATDYEMHILSGGNVDLSMEPTEAFEKAVQGKDYFIVTLMGELDAQPGLKAILFNNYNYWEGDPYSYIIFDLSSHK